MTDYNIFLSYSMGTDPWNKFKSTSKLVYVCVYVEKTRANNGFLYDKKICDFTLKSPILLKIGQDPQWERDRSVTEWVALPSCQPAEGCCSLFTRQRSAIFNFLLAAHLSPHAARPWYPSITEADSSDWGRWPTIGTVLLALPIRTADVGGCSMSTA